MIKIGDKLPRFALPDQEANLHTSDSFLGSKSLFFFYPRASTPGCTAQACSLQAHFSQFQAHHIKIVGISNDEVSKQKKYHDKFGFPFPLLCDVDHQVTEAFGIWQLKKFMGKEFMGLVRTSFVFDENGICIEIIDKVITKTHAEQFQF